MDKGYYEFLVEGKPNKCARFFKEALIVLAIVFLVASFLLGNLLFIFLAVISGFASFICSKYTEVEYEYLFLEKELSVDKIYNKERRKHVETFNMEKVLVFAPEKSSKSDRYSSVKDLKVSDYSSCADTGELKKFEMYYEGSRKIIFSLDEEMIKAFKSKCPRVFSEY